MNRTNKKQNSIASISYSKRAMLFSTGDIANVRILVGHLIRIYAINRGLVYLRAFIIYYAIT